MITERPWVTGGLISLATSVVIFGLLIVTQPGSAQPTASDSSLVVAAAPATSAATPVTPSAAPTVVPTSAAAKPKAVHKAKPKPKVTPPAKKTTAKKKAAATVKAGAGGPGVGRIQFGKTYTGRATFYGATGAGNCSFDASSNLMVGAMNQADYDNSQACGAFLSVTGPNGTVKIRIVDRCPECPPGAIDLSQQAFAKIAPLSAGRVTIHWHLLSPSGLGSVSYRYKSGSSQYWCGIQMLNHRNPIRSMAIKVGTSWRTLERQDYNYFLSPSGTGCGGTIRTTDIYGNQLTQSGIRIAPDAVQAGKGQFPAHTT